MDALGLYIHIPFCLRKCAYCNFVSYPGRLDDIDRYIDALIGEARLYEELLQNRIIDSVFIGGGTPSLLSPAQTEKLIAPLQSISAWENAEITMEANPETLHEEKLSAYSELGINRLSIGLQTHENAILNDIGRGHSWETFLHAYDLASHYFSNINVDIMFGLPGQTVKSFAETLKRLIELSPKHMSAYALKLETDTPLAKRYEGADEDIDREMYHLAVDMLNQVGYTHYETSNFAKPGNECRHNLKYWTGEEYLGLGIAAYSYLKEGGGRRFGNTSAFDDYFRCISARKHPTCEDDWLTQNDQIIEYIMLRLRLNNGIDFDDYRRRFSGDLINDFADAVEFAQNAGLIIADDKGIRPTLKGFDLQNALIGEFINKL